LRIQLPKQAKGLLLLVGAIFAAIGVLGLYSPIDVIGATGLQAPNIGARSEVRATYGGVYLLFGLYFLWSAFRNGWRLPALRVAAVFLGGLVLGRVVSFIVDGASINPWIWVFAVIEIVLFGLSTWVVVRDSRAS